MDILEILKFATSSLWHFVASLMIFSVFVYGVANFRLFSITINHYDSENNDDNKSIKEE